MENEKASFHKEVNSTIETPYYFMNVFIIT